MLEFLVLCIAGLAWALIDTNCKRSAAQQRVDELKAALQAHREWRAFPLDGDPS